MHPILASPDRLALYLVCWLIVAGLLGAVYATTGEEALFASLALVVPVSILYSFVCLSAWYVCRATPLATTGASRVVVNHVAAAFLSAGFWLLVWEFWSQMLDGFPPFGGSVEGYRAQAPLIFAAGTLLFGLASMFHYLLIAFETARDAERRELGLEVLAREAELRALRAQIDPHFLFNSLHSISALTTKDAAGARQMCLLLADFFRGSVRLGGRDSIRLEEEIEMVRQYLAIERIRCGDRLSTDIEVDPECASCAIPPLILQPLVENAVRHGIQSLVDGGTIRITAGCESGMLDIRVENPFEAGVAGRTGSGVGLDNVKRRLRTLYQREAETRISNAGGRFRVDLRFPCADAGRDGA